MLLKTERDFGHNKKKKEKGQNVTVYSNIFTQDIYFLAFYKDSERKEIACLQI